MFKSARWRSEKNKVKAVFKLQFHAAQLTQVGGEALVVSVVPADIGKPTVKSDKALVREGSCFWENAVYETVKFNRDPKSGKIHERIYYFVIGTGSSKAGVIGEASVDFSNYAEATKVSLVSLPLKNSKTEAVLNVSIQRIQEPVDQRENEESENGKMNSRNNSLRSQLSNGDIDGTLNSNSAEAMPLNKTVSHIAELDGNCRASSGSDLTISSSESSLGVETPWEPHLKNGNVNKGPKSDEHHRSQWDWIGNSVIEANADYSSSTPRGASLRLNSTEASEIVIEKLKVEVAALSRQAEISELELQTLRKQIVKESKKGQDLFRESVCLKEERDVLKGECEKLKAMQRRMFESRSSNSLHFEPGDSWAIVEELRQELNHAKELNANLQIQLQKTQESNSELLLAVHDLDEILEQKNKEMSNLSNSSLERDGDRKSRVVAASPSRSEDEEQKALEELVKEHSDAKEAYLLEQQIIDLRSEIEIYRRDKDELEMQMEQLALDYEIMKQENHDMSYKLEQSQIQEQLKMQYECSSSFSTARDLEFQIENLENELKRRSEESSDSSIKISELESQMQVLQNELKRQSEESLDSSIKIGELKSQIKTLQNKLERQSKEASDSLIKKAELESQIENLQNELKKRPKESLDSSIKMRELEAHVRTLEEELEKQAQGFEADLEALTVSKVEQEQRAIRAEETLRKTRWQNANTAERLQEEFRRLSVQMTSTFEANEKLAAKALAEANELRIQKSHLEGLLQKASAEHQSVKNHYESRLKQLENQVILMSNKIEELQSEIKDREDQQKNPEENWGILSNEISVLKGDIEALVAKNKIFSDEMRGKETLKNELERMRVSIKELHLTVEQGNDERTELERSLISVKNESEESQKELNKLRFCIGEKETIIGNMRMELDSVRTEYEELKTSSRVEDDLEKEKLRKQLAQLKNDLRKKEDTLNCIEKKTKDVNGWGTTHDVVKAGSKANKPLPRGSKEVVDLKERIKLLEGQIKLKEAALEKSTNTFLEKEMDLHNKIGELEESLEVLNQNNAQYNENEAIKDVSAEDQSWNAKSDVLKDSTKNTGDFDELMNDISLLKERNKSMERELKEMQERYSEISLKFAEVEGERQQLVMKLRNLKR